MGWTRFGVVLCAALLAAGCGGGGGDKDERTRVEPARFGDLLARVPHTEPAAVALDVARARTELGLAPDAAPPPGHAPGNDGQRRLRALVAATVLNYPIRDNGPLDRAVDYRRVTALVRADGPPEVLMIATREPWDELKEALRKEGWRERADGVLERPAGGEGRVLRWVAGRNGLAVAAGDPRLAPRVLAGRERTSRDLLALMEAARGPARAARLAHSPCVEGIAAGYSPAAAGGEFVVAVDDVPPRPYRLKPSRSRPLPAAYETQTPRAAGGRVTVPFTYEASTDPAEQPGALALASAGLFEYRC
jgi:hypothetical protein